MYIVLAAVFAKNWNLYIVPATVFATTSKETTNYYEVSIVPAAVYATEESAKH